MYRKRTTNFIIQPKEKYVTMAQIKGYENGMLYIKRDDRQEGESIGIYKNNNYENKIGNIVELWYESDRRSFGRFFIKEK